MDGRLVVQAGVRAVPVVVMEPEGQVSGALGGVEVGASVGSFAEQALYDALGLAVGSRRVRSGTDGLEVEPPTEPGEGPGGVAGAVIGHDPLEGDAERGEVAQRDEEGPTGALSALAREDGGDAHPRGVVEGDVDKLPSGSGRGLAPVARHPVAGANEAPEFLGVQVQQVSRVSTVIENSPTPG